MPVDRSFLVNRCAFLTVHQRMRTIKLLIEYDGTGYSGWQIQPGHRTIQGIFEKELSCILGETVRLIGSGRTDAGVHAICQVAHFRTNNPMDVSAMQRALNSLLPEDIAVKEIEETEEGFHARKSAKSKVYEYRILNRPLRSVFLRHYCWHVPERLNLIAMRKATSILIGEHDFRSFRSSGSSVRTTVRSVMRAEWRKGEEDLLFFEIEATGFLKQMVRTIVGTLVEVGRGSLSPEDFATILQAGDRRKAGPTAPAHGLFLKEVKY